jgi:hypothetical protein
MLWTWLVICNGQRRPAQVLRSGCGRQIRAHLGEALAAVFPRLHAVHLEHLVAEAKELEQEQRVHMASEGEHPREGRVLIDHEDAAAQQLEEALSRGSQRAAFLRASPPAVEASVEDAQEALREHILTIEALEQHCFLVRRLCRWRADERFEQLRSGPQVGDILVIIIADEVFEHSHNRSAQIAVWGCPAASECSVILRLLF